MNDLYYGLQILQIIGGFVLGIITVGGFAYKVMKKLSETTRGVLASEISKQHDKCKMKGFVDVYDHANFKNLYAIYKANKWNSFVDDIHKDFLSLPRRDV